MKKEIIKILDEDLIYGKELGVSKKEAKSAYIKGFKESMEEHKEFWKNKKIELR